MSLYTQLAKRFILSNAPPGLQRNLLPLKLTVASTFLCNHRCKMCDIWQVYRKDKEKLKKELTRDDFAHLFDQMKDSMIYLDWGGGEPFLRPDMVDILKDAAAICGKLSSFVITTNGLMTERILDYMRELAPACPRQLFAIGVSLDGDQPNHDFIRGKDGAFATATETIRRLKELGRVHSNIEVKISYTISYRNAGRFEDFHDRVLRPLDLNVGDVGFGLEHVGGLFQTAIDPHKAVGRVSESEFREGARRDVEYVIRHLEAENLPTLQRMKSMYRIYFLKEIPGFLEHPQKMVIPCKATRSSLYVDPYGYIYPCIVWSRCLGHFRDGLARILASDLTATTRREIDEGKCPVCWNACEAIPSLLSSMRMVSCVARSFTDARVIRGLLGTRRAA
jgi:MoaA/NifB/PqqE/SkfB family radical SAM enzyme